MTTHSVGDMELPYRIILASNSPRRRELLAGLGIDFTVKVIGGIDESWPHNLKGEDIPLYISREKAAPSKASSAPEELVITADTIVYVDGEVLTWEENDSVVAKEHLHVWLYAIP